MRGFMVDIFQGIRNGRSVIFGAGRLESGESFGLVDDRHVPSFYVRNSDRAAATQHLKSHRPTCEPSDFQTMDGEGVSRILAATTADLRRMNSYLLDQDVRTYEGDIDYVTRYRMSTGIRGPVLLQGEIRPSKHVDKLFVNPIITPTDGACPCRVLAVDIETNADATEVFGLSLVTWQLGSPARGEEVLLVGRPEHDDPPHLSCYQNEKALLYAFVDRITALDPDIITGWNVIDFDLFVLARRAAHHKIPLTLGRTRDTSYARPSQYFGSSKMNIQGRQVLDALKLVRHTLSRFDDLRLDTVAKALLRRGKTLVVEEWQNPAAAIAEIYRGNRRAFCEYVLEDSRLVRDILVDQRLLELTLARSQLTGLTLERAWGSIAPFEALYIAEMNKAKIVAPTLGVDKAEQWGGSGGLVLEPRVGLHEHVLIFDFKSLYPSIMRTFNIDPVAFARGKLLDEDSRDAITAPNGANFDRTPGILPELLHEFFKRRECAKANGDSVSSYMYKIIMNSFYGVLGTDSCRFADPSMADAITGFGQMLLLKMQTYFQSRGLPVLYGDTDSLFVSLPGAGERTVADILCYGKNLCQEANVFLREALSKDYGATSHMELEFEKYYRYLFLPADRQGDGSRAKNYAGLEVTEAKETLQITGLEAVRSDWTPLAQKMQKELLWMMFHQRGPGSMKDYIRAEIKAMFSGQRESELVYRKKIRRPIEAYVKTTPPHIKAAKLLPMPVKVVRYLITESGPQPLGFVKAKTNYAHYLENQIRPIVEGLAPFAGFDTGEACDTGAGFRFTEDMPQ